MVLISIKTKQMQQKNQIKSDKNRKKYFNNDNSTHIMEFNLF